MTGSLEPMGYCDHRLVPLRELSVPVWDAGLVHGVIVSEQVRTFQRKPFLLDRHFDRWLRGLELLGIAIPCDYATLSDRLCEMVDRNAGLLPATSEQGICFFATPGDQASLLWASGNQPRIIPSRFYAHSYPLPSSSWQAHYHQGAALVTTLVREVSNDCWPKSVKIRSRLHYYLAQRQVALTQPEAFPLLLNEQGQIADSAIGSIAGYQKGSGIIVRPASQRYASISVGFLIELAEELGIPVVEREFTLKDILEFEELFLVSTPWCILPVDSVDLRPIGSRQIDNQHHDDQQGDVPARFAVFHQLIAAWSQRVGVSITT